MSRLTLPLLVALGLLLAACQSTSRDSAAASGVGAHQHLHTTKGHNYDKGP